MTGDEHIWKVTEFFEIRSQILLKGKNIIILKICFVQKAKIPFLCWKILEGFYLPKQTITKIPCNINPEELNKYVSKIGQRVPQNISNVERPFYYLQI